MIKPLNDYVAIQAIEEEAVTASGIYLGTTKNKQPMGKVVAVKKAVVFSDGPKGGFGTLFSKVEVGDIVYYKNGIEIKEGNETYIMVKESDLIAVVEVEE